MRTHRDTNVTIVDVSLQRTLFKMIKKYDYLIENTGIIKCMHTVSKLRLGHCQQNTYDMKADH